MDPAQSAPRWEITIPEEPVAPAGAWVSRIPPPPLDFLPPTRECDPYPKGAPLVTSVPDAGSPEAYNEDEFVHLWTQVYLIFLKIRYLKEADVDFPPEDTGRHADINQDRLRNEFSMSDQVISLLERLPYLAKGAGGVDGTAFFPFGQIFNYLNVNEAFLDTCRDPHPMNSPARNIKVSLKDYLLPDDVALLYPYEHIGLVWILDTKANTIRTLSGYVEPNSRNIPDDFQEERPEEPDHYRNWPAFHAPFILKRYIRDLWNLEFVPVGAEWILSNHEIDGALIAHKLREYGWPDDFLVDQWERDFDRIRDAAGDVSEAVRVKGLDPDAVVERWRREPEQIPL